MARLGALVLGSSAALYISLQGGTDAARCAVASSLLPTLALLVGDTFKSKHDCDLGGVARVIGPLAHAAAAFMLLRGGPNKVRVGQCTMNMWAGVSAVTGLSLYVATAKTAALGWGVSMSGEDVVQLKSLGGAIAGKALLVWMLSEGYYPGKVLGCTAAVGSLQQVAALRTPTRQLQHISAAKALLLFTTTATAAAMLLG
eukprot:CAMPEP_0183343448 /NCGR_PEP_ID=MMETSP0164_2-20130417/9367_1 /TAXON_ID=221442 /ORGANISM="Coccolithus pelagicus ssp braarudi, Strain PLY182g" /LENGTH=199 /DNA_ID=CAMNT_0025514277 /DNA_START=206 /DNA_END=805 /DNA_ORIENTATION=-